MTTGAVKWLNNAKGFGFIAQNNGDDMFVHHPSIVANGFRTLEEGSSFTFDIKNDPKGPATTNVVAQ